MKYFKHYKVTIKTEKLTATATFKEYYEAEEFVNMFKNPVSVSIESVYESNENIY